MVLLDALHLKTIFSNVGRMIRGATDENTSRAIDVLSSTPDYYKKIALSDIEIVLKAKSIISEDLDSIAQKINLAFKTSDVKLLNEVMNKHGKTIAIVLALSTARWENQKLLWQHINQNNSEQMPVDILDKEIARIDELAMNLELTLPSLKGNIFQTEKKHKEEDYHYTLRGGYNVPIDKMYNLVVYNIKRTGFLKIVEANEGARVIRFTSDKIEDPRGIIEFTITLVDKIDGGSYFRLHIEDE
ncbi:hypothetical protein [Candidatus Nitrososphaera gargensis]|uniref:hypothetical protein n=1 Tax=Candidatus Nitrososphaera gargensis TaxID=497727 RepID=UPI0011E4FB43|nr:hypothetical protein [Candidatus Nitrososphaera gargensis]